MNMVHSLENLNSSDDYVKNNPNDYYDPNDLNDPFCHFMTQGRAMTLFSTWVRWLHNISVETLGEDPSII